MKKRKSPVLLISLLAVLVGGVVVYQLWQERGAAPPGGDPNEQVTMQQNTTNTEGLEKAVGQNTTPTKPRGPRGPAEQGQEPSIEVKPGTGTYPKPQPVPTGSPDSGWYKR